MSLDHPCPAGSIIELLYLFATVSVDIFSPAKLLVSRFTATGSL